MSKNCKIRDLFSRFSSGNSISSTNIIPSGSFPVYGGNGLRGYTNIHNFDGECVIIGRQGAYCGNVKYFSGKGYMTEHAIVGVANELNNSRFLSYKLSLMNLGRYAGQSAQPGLSVETLLDVDIDIPDKITQDRIAFVLSQIDEKIENNNAIIAKLDEMAKLIYDYWFVQFDFPDENGRPYKSSGGKMMWNEELKREIPEGWKSSVLSDITYYSENRIEACKLNANNYVGTDNLLQNMRGKANSQYVPSDGYAIAFSVGDCLLSNIRPYFKKIWLSDIDGGCSSDVLCIKSKKECLSSYVYNTCARDDFFAYDMQGSKGSKMPRGDKQHIMNYPIAFNLDYASLYSKRVISLHTMMNRLRNESEELSKLRDFLLPLLINGQVKIINDNA